LIRYTFALFENGRAATETMHIKHSPAKGKRKLVWRKMAKPDIVAEFGGNVE
jgi:hypothetical protein